MWRPDNYKEIVEGVRKRRGGTFYKELFDLGWDTCIEHLKEKGRACDPSDRLYIGADVYAKGYLVFIPEDE